MAIAVATLFLAVSVVGDRIRVGKWLRSPRESRWYLAVCLVVGGFGLWTRPSRYLHY